MKKSDEIISKFNLFSTICYNQISYYNQIHAKVHDLMCPVPEPSIWRSGRERCVCI